MANEFKVKNGIKFPDGTVQTTASTGGGGGSYLPLTGGTMTGAITFDASQTWPTFNQSTTGTAANVTGTVAIANGGTGATSAATALTNLGAQATLISGTNIKTVNGNSLLGSGNVTLGASAITISNKTANYTVVAGDLGSIINCTSGTFTVSLTAAATLGSGFSCWIWNTDSAGTLITIDPNASETIDGLTTLTLRSGQGVEIICDGTNWQTGSGKALRGYSENFSATSTRPTTAGLGSIALGSLCSAAGNNSIAGGYGASAAQDGKWAYSSSVFANVGDAQTGTMVLRASTTDATATILKSSASAAGTSNQVILPNNSAFAFSGLIVARQKTSDGTNSAAWRVEGLLLRGATAATTSLVNSATTVISNVPGWTLTLTADTTNGGLAVTATGAAATNIYWVATIQTSEVTYA